MEKDQVLFASNGKAYTIDETTGKARAVDRTPTKFVKNVTEDFLPEKIEDSNTNVLYQYLKHKLEGVSYDKRGYVRYKGFRMRYNYYGFEIVDTLNFSEKMNINKYHNDLACPEDVYTWLVEHTDRPVVTSPKVAKKATDVAVDSLTAKFKVISEKENPPVTIDREKILSEKTASLKDRGERLVKHRIDVFVNKLLEGLSKKGGEKITIAEAKKLIKRISIKESFVKPATKLVSLCMKRKIVFKTFEKDFTLLMSELKKDKDKPVRPPRFTGAEIEPYEPVTITEDDNKLVLEQRGPGGKKMKSSLTKHELLVNQVLVDFPKAMALLMKVAKGETFDLINMDYERFVKDPFEVYNKITIRDTEHGKYLAKVCKEILWANEMPTHLDYVYHNQTPKAKKGLWVRIYFLNDCTFDDGQIVSTEGKIKVLTEYSGVVELLKSYKVSIHKTQEDK